MIDEAAAKQMAAKIWSKKPFKSYLNLFRVTLERRFRREFLKGFPFILYFEPTTFCNLKCPACATGTGLLDRTKSSVNLEDFKKTIDALSGWIFELFVYNWGEPLLHPHFTGLVKYASDQGILVRASSNLSMPLNENDCEEIVRSGLYSLKVGIDGASPEVHRIYRKGSNLETVHSNLRTIASIKKKLQSETPMILVQYHVFAHNEAEIEAFRLQMPDLGVDWYNAGTAWLPPNNDEIKKPKNLIYDAYRKNNLTISKLKRKGDQLRPCSWLYYTSVINPNGFISPCCSIISERLDFGKLNFSDTDTREEIGKYFQTEWNGNKYTAARGLFRGKTKLKRWIDQNLCDLQPDGMAFSQRNENISLICSNCYIPHTIEQWSDECKIFLDIHLAKLKNSIKSLEIRNTMLTAIQSFILALSVSFQ